MNYKMLTDVELFQLLQQSDRKAFTEIYERYKTQLYIHAYHKLNDKEEVRDVVQQLFSILWMRRSEIILNSNLAGYLFASARNSVLKIIARKNIQSNYISSIQNFANNQEVITDHVVRESEFRKLIDREIALLPPKMREVFELSRKEHLSHKEIAQKLGISEQTVSKQISNALKILRKKLTLFAYLAVFLKM